MTKKEPKKGKEEKEEIEPEDIPFVGGLFTGIEKLVDLAEKAEQAGGKIEKKGEIKGLGGRKDVKGVYGFSVRTGIGKKREVQTFGNIQRQNKQKEKKAGQGKIKMTETREPLVDVFDEQDQIRIVAELPGVAEQDIKLDLNQDILMLEAGDKKRKYSKEILLPAKVDFESREKKFNNGILEIKVKKVE